jgi:Phosphodiester glycosidase
MGAHAVSLGDRLLRPRRVREFVERLLDGAAATVYVATYPRRGTRVRVVALDRPEPLHRWARQAGIGEALSGGFYAPGGIPLGELHSNGNVHMTVPFDAPWDARRSCVSIIDGHVEIVPRGVLPNRARGDLLQAGPLLVANCRPLIADAVRAADPSRDQTGEAGARDPQGFAAAAAQFDCDITAGRHPRAAFGIARDRYFAVVCDGRSIRDAGMTLGELARLMADLGASSAINLCGGASASLVSGGALHNRPRDQNGVSLLGGRPVASAIVFER